MVRWALIAVAAAAVFVPHAAASRPTFVKSVDNPWFPLRPGTTYEYRGIEGGSAARDVVRVTSREERIDGVRCTRVSDLLYHGGRVTERTTDWYAQDSRGNVWYFGEATAELDRRGRVTSREGSWRAGVDGARPGIVMPAHPRVGQSFAQEQYTRHAEDRFSVLSLKATVAVPYTTSTHGLLTKEWTPLEPGVVDHKLYVRGIGLAEERAVAGGSDHMRLVAVRR